jgi:hypothetical protein
MSSPRWPGEPPPTARLAFSSHGARLGIEASDHALLDQLAAALPAGHETIAAAEAEMWFTVTSSAEATGARLRYTLQAEAQQMETGFRLQRIIDTLEFAIRLEVCRRSPDRLFIHAGAVVWNGHGIVIPGRSGSGKTTLVAALVEAGASYCSDEYAVLDAAGLLYPYSRPLSFRRGDHRRVRKNVTADLGGIEAMSAAPIRLVVHTTYRPLAVWRPQRLSSGAGALALFANVVAARERPSFAFSVLSEAMAGVVVFEGDRGEAKDAAREILALISTFPLIPEAPGR